MTCFNTEDCHCVIKDMYCINLHFHSVLVHVGDCRKNYKTKIIKMEWNQIKGKKQTMGFCGVHVKQTMGFSGVHVKQTMGFSGVHVAPSLVFCVSFVVRCLSFYIFTFGHYVVCPFFDLQILITPLVSSNSSY